jgi:hypothetical protein
MEDNMKENLSPLRYGGDFLNPTSKAQYRKVGKLDFIRIMHFCRRHCQENQKTSQRLEENICKDLSGRGLYPQTHKEHLKFDMKTNSLIKYGQKT